jgi:hypothetical protein
MLMKRKGHSNIYVVLGGGKPLEQYFPSWNGRKYLKPRYNMKY